MEQINQPTELERLHAKKAQLSGRLGHLAGLRAAIDAEWKYLVAERSVTEDRINELEKE